MKNAKKVTTLFAISCMLFIIVGPMAIWVVHQKAAFPGELAKSEIEANETFSPTHHRSKTAEIWAYPATTNVSDVRCITAKEGEEIPLNPKNTETTILDAEMTHLFTNDSDETAIFDRVQCQGGGLETIYMTSHFSDHTKNRFIIIISIATPILAGIGFILYRRNKRKPVKKY